MAHMMHLAVVAETDCICIVQAYRSSDMAGLPKEVAPSEQPFKKLIHVPGMLQIIESKNSTIRQLKAGVLGSAGSS